jgi:MoaA/NifB/PqqE/SkfB family radical SAM enzyme
MIIEKFRSLFSGEPHIESSPEITAEIKKNYNGNRLPEARPYACYAPLKNMYFGHYGKVGACCYNRDHVLGVYPEQTIKQMWFGQEANKLRANLKAYNFSSGCQDCMQQLIAGNFDGTKAKQYDTHRMNENKFPSVMEFELENTCNLECIMCSGDYSSLIRAKREKRAELPTPYDDGFIKQLEAFIPYLQEVKFYGGEPFLIPVYYKIWDKIIELNPEVRISVQTNGTTLNNRVKEIFQKTNFHISVSLDSLNKERYEFIRRNSHFETVMDNLKYFHTYCLERNTFFGISTCLMQQNWFEAPDFIRFCNELNVQIYFHTVLYPDFASLRQLSRGKLKEIYDTLLAEYETFPEDSPIKKKNKKHYHDFLLQLLEWSYKHNANPETEDIDSLDELLAFLTRKTFERTDIDEEQKKVSVGKIAKNLEGLAKILPPETSIRELVKTIDPRDPSQMQTFLSAAENGQIEQALEYLKLKQPSWLIEKQV